MISINIFDIIISKLYYWQKFNLAILLEVDKDLNIYFN